MRHYLLIFCLAILSIFVHGYQFAVSDQEIFIPYILKSADSSLFPDDLLFKQPSANASIFYALISFLTKFFDLQVIFFTGYLVFQFIFFLGIFRLAKIILGSDKLAYLSLLPFLLPKFIGGTATSTYEIFFGYRLIGIVALIYYLVFLFEQKYYQAAIVAGVGFLFHPLSVIPNLLLLPALALSDRKVKIAIRSLAIFLLIIFPLLILARTDSAFFASAFDRQWLSIIKERTDYVLPSTWSIRGWAAFMLYPALILIFASKLKKSVSAKIKVIGIVSATVFIISFFLLDVLKIPIFAQFQLARSITPLAYIGLIVAPLLLIYKNPIIRIIGWAAFIALSANLFNYSILNFPSYQNLNAKIQLPKQADDWINLQLWAKANTPIDSAFLVPPNQTGFRIFSQRPIVGDIKDGAVVMYSQKYAQYWKALMDDLKNYENFTDQNFIQIKNKYNNDYLITLNNQKLNFPLIYKNSTFHLYKL